MPKEHQFSDDFGPCLGCGKYVEQLIDERYCTMFTFDTDFSQHKFPKIAQALLEMSYDNGGVHRGRTEQDILDDLGPMLDTEKYLPEQLEEFEKFLASLSDDDLSTVCSGEHENSEAIVKRFGEYEKLELFLTHLFEIC